VAGSRFAVPGAGVVALGSALSALQLTKRPRRMRGDDTHDPADLDEIWDE
jgi:hypothetical protein